MDFKPEDYSEFQYQKLRERWLRPALLQKHLKSFAREFELQSIGNSFEGRPISSLRWGRGPQKILLWSQMHGNEPTASLAILDLCNFLKKPGPYQDLRDELAEKISLVFIPQLNPDGAEAFTRRNAQQIDINRDAVAQQSPEMRGLQKLLEEFQPHWCFNLHDQRNFFSLGPEAQPATISFLSASAGPDRALSPVRKQSMQLITQMIRAVQNLEKGLTGRFTDEFYPLSLGDNLHRLNIPTVLVECGAYFNDPYRNKARHMTFIALLEAFSSIASANWQQADIQSYLDLPLNESRRRDLIIRNCRIQNKDQSTSQLDLGLTIRESVNTRKGQLEKHWLLTDVGDLHLLKGFEELEGGLISSPAALKLDSAANFTLSDSPQKIEFKNGLWVI